MTMYVFSYSKYMTSRHLFEMVKAFFTNHQTFKMQTNKLLLIKKYILIYGQKIPYNSLPYGYIEIKIITRK